MSTVASARPKANQETRKQPKSRRVEVRQIDQSLDRRIYVLTDVAVSVAAAIRAFNMGNDDHACDMIETAMGELGQVYSASNW